MRSTAMMGEKKARVKGMTLVEVLIGLILVVVIIAVSYNFYGMSKRAWVYLTVQGQVQRDAAEAMEEMIHGVLEPGVDYTIDGNGDGIPDNTPKGIQEAQNIIIPTADQIQFEDQDNPGVFRSFSVQGDQLIYTDAASVNTVIIDDGVSALNFTRPPGILNFVNINLTLVRPTLDRDVSVTINTSIEVRNM